MLIPWGKFRLIADETRIELDEEGRANDAKLARSGSKSRMFHFRKINGFSWVKAYHCESVTQFRRFHSVIRDLIFIIFLLWILKFYLISKVNINENMQFRERFFNDDLSM